MNYEVVLDTDNVGNRTFQVVIDSKLHDLTVRDIENEGTKKFVLEHLGQGATNETLLKFNEAMLTLPEANRLFNSLTAQFSYNK